MAAYRTATASRGISAITALDLRFLVDESHDALLAQANGYLARFYDSVSYTHLRAHETSAHL
eukprot:2342867-Alexandrium_andersonii.AAC.1